MPEEDENGAESSEEAVESPGRGEKYCKNCGEIIDDQAELCPECGVRQTESDNSDPNINVNVENSNQNVQNQGGNGNQIEGTKSRMLAALLGIFLGSFGLHKFYLGQAGRGILFLIFFWTGIPGIIGFIQGVSYLLMSDQKFARKFG